MAPVGALAADADLPVKAPVVVDTPWWTHGFIEFGGRGFLNDPQRDGHIFQGGKSLAKYYEYSDVKPGPFGDFFAAAGSKNGLYEIDVWGKNVGYNDQRYDAYLSKAGEQYFNFQWDQTPHVYSTSGSTLFNTSGNALTLANPNIGTQMFNAGLAPGFPTIPSAATAASTAKTNAISTIINQNVHPTDVGIRRDTASVDYRYTPTDNWDFKANYSNLRRTGSQVDGVLFTNTNNGSRVDVAKPVADTTQNFGVNGEYSGTSAWGKKFNAMVGYNGSVYQDDFNNYTVQNPFCSGLVCAGNGNPTTPLAMMSTPPNNQMNGVSGTLGADLPLNSRYMGTVAYSGMRQNDAFLPFASTGIPGLAMSNGQPAASLATVPTIVRTQGGVGVTSLDGKINTVLVNNVLTTQITPDLKTKLSYRYYDYDNQTPELHLTDWIIADAASAVATHPVYTPVNSLSLGYIKQDAGAEATWRPVNSVNIGGAYGYEHYDWTRADASATAENSGKVYADWKPTAWITARASGLFSERRADNYNYFGNVGFFQWPAPSNGTLPSGDNYSALYRQFYLDDRDRAQGKFAVDVNVLRNLTVTPTFNIKNDTFLLTQNQLGVSSDRSYAAGVEAAYAATPDATFLFSYMNEQRTQNVLWSNTQLAPFSATLAYSCPTAITCQLASTSVRDNVNTFIVGMNYAVIPQKFDLHLGYTLSMSTNSQPLFFSNGTGPASGGYPSLSAAGVANPGQFPNVNTTFQRVDLTGKYIVDKDFVASLGLKGEVALKLRYAWERNSATNWNTDTMQPYMYTAMMNQPQAAYVQWMAGNNPNYNVHLLGGAVSFAW
jgi:MtrB/PioB family decaheme-associated outer membrane protein